MGQYKIRLVGNWISLSDSNRKILDELDSQIFPVDVGCKKRQPGRYWWIVYAGKKPIGFAGIEIGNREAFLCRAGILIQHRGHGIQKKLIRSRERYAKKLGIHDIITYTHTLSIASVNNLINSGYKLYDPTHHWAGTQRNETLYFTKKI